MMTKILVVITGILVAWLAWSSLFSGLRGNDDLLIELEQRIASYDTGASSVLWSESDQEQIVEDIERQALTVEVSLRPDGLSLERRVENATSQFVARYNPTECAGLEDAMGGPLGSQIRSWNSMQTPADGLPHIGNWQVSTLPGTESELLAILECYREIPGIRVDSWSFGYLGEGLEFPTEDSGGQGVLSMEGKILYRFIVVEEPVDGEETNEVLLNEETESDAVDG